jgi:SAM-dependent methyltransferase
LPNSTLPVGLAGMPSKVDFDPEIRRRMALNERNWDARTPVHVKSDFYALGRRDPLEWILPFEWDALGSLAGKDVAHLQCHLGVESMGLVKAGARVVGLDFSAKAVEAAGVAAGRENLDISYVRADVYDAVDVLGRQRFDVVYTGKGSLCYLPDLTRWAQVVAGLLRPGGFLYLVEFHPLLNAFGLMPRHGEPVDLTVRHDYLEAAARSSATAPTPTPTVPHWTATPCTTSGRTAWARSSPRWPVPACGSTTSSNRTCCPFRAGRGWCGPTTAGGRATAPSPACPRSTPSRRRRSYFRNVPCTVCPLFNVART